MRTLCSAARQMYIRSFRISGTSANVTCFCHNPPPISPGWTEYPMSASTIDPEHSTAPAPTPLAQEELRLMDAYWRACNYLSVGMIYLRSNPLLREPLKPEHIKNRLLGHWGSDPGQSFTWIHLNRLIRKYDLNVIFVSGPGHGAPASLANSYLEGYYSEV